MSSGIVILCVIKMRIFNCFVLVIFVCWFFCCFFLVFWFFFFVFFCVLLCGVGVLGLGGGVGGGDKFSLLVRLHGLRWGMALWNWSCRLLDFYVLCTRKLSCHCVLTCFSLFLFSFIINRFSWVKVEVLTVRVMNCLD